MSDGDLYKGDRTMDGVAVSIGGKPLSSFYDKKRYTEVGFEWGYCGEEPMQLSFAILMDHTNDQKIAEKYAEIFMKKVVSEFDNEWELSDSDIEKWVDFFSSTK